MSVLLLNGRQNLSERVKNGGGRGGCLSMVSFHCEVTLWHSGLDFLPTSLAPAQSSHRDSKAHLPQLLRLGGRGLGEVGCL